MASTSMSRSRLIIIGSGPIGIEFALRAVHNQVWDVIIVEKGQPMDNLKKWGFVTLFSSFELNTTQLGLETLDSLNIPRPHQDEFPTAQEFIEKYLVHLWKYLEMHATIITETKVVTIGRGSLLKGDMNGRVEASFSLLLEESCGREFILVGDAVVDISGNFCHPNWLGKGGIPALGERKYLNEIEHHIPNIESNPQKFVGKTTLVIGSGYSAVTTINLIREVAITNQSVDTAVTKIVWVTRKEGEVYELLTDDPLPQRKRLCEFGNSFSTYQAPQDDKFQVERIGCATVSSIEKIGSSFTVVLDSSYQSVKADIDNIVANVGYRPDTTIYQELQVHQCYATEGPMKLAAALMASSGGGGDCLAQVAPGPATLLNPEPNFLILGIKSYGRGSAFLLKIGHEQIAMGIDLLKP